jgi:hypothetical protein
LVLRGLLLRWGLQLIIHLPNTVHAAECSDNRESLVFNPQLAGDCHGSILNHGGYSGLRARTLQPPVNHL